METLARPPKSAENSLSTPFLVDTPHPVKCADCELRARSFSPIRLDRAKLSTWQVQFVLKWDKLIKEKLQSWQGA
jgi:hypothetical protein